MPWKYKHFLKWWFLLPGLRVSLHHDPSSHTNFSHTMSDYLLLLVDLDNNGMRRAAFLKNVSVIQWWILWRWINCYWTAQGRDKITVLCLCFLTPAPASPPFLQDWLLGLAVRKGTVILEIYLQARVNMLGVEGLRGILLFTLLISMLPHPFPLRHTLSSQISYMGLDVIHQGGLITYWTHGCQLPTK